jgi:hypothetical protein
MTEWRECKLGDVIVLNYGKALPEKKRVFGNIPVYSSAGLTGYHNESLVNGRGIIIGRNVQFQHITTLYIINNVFSENEYTCIKCTSILSPQPL